MTSWSEQFVFVYGDLVARGVGGDRDPWATLYVCDRELVSY